jgi:hypothetical protein
MFIALLAIVIFSKPNHKVYGKKKVNLSKKSLLAEGDLVDSEECYEAYVALRDTEGTDPDDNGNDDDNDDDDDSSSRKKGKKVSIKLNTEKHKPKQKRFKETLAQLLTAFKEECAATAAKEACALLIGKFEGGTATSEETLTFPNVCGVADPNAGGTGSGGFSSSKVSILLMALGLTLANIYFK